MGSKGSKTTQTQTNSYQANPAVAAASNQALSFAQNAANQPYNLPAAPVAGFTPDQLNAFQGVRNAQGMTNPYFASAVDYANRSAQPTTQAQIQNYLNPYASYALAGLNEDIGVQNRDLRGNMVQAAGGVGADRVAVGQAEKFRQDQLARGQLMASFYDPAMQAAIGDRGREANAAYAMGTLGQGHQNSALQVIQALLGTGGMQQSQNQNELMSDYNLQVQKFMHPYQNAEFLSNIAAQQGNVQKGTSTTQTETQQPKPSILSQIVGAGMTMLGMPGVSGSLFGGSGKGTSFGGGNYWGVGQGNPWGAQNYMMPTMGMAHGGAVSAGDMGRGFARGGDTFDERFGGFSFIPPSALNDGGLPQGSFEDRFSFPLHQAATERERGGFEFPPYEAPLAQSDSPIVANNDAGGMMSADNLGLGKPVGGGGDGVETTAANGVPIPRPRDISPNDSAGPPVPVNSPYAAIDTPYGPSDYVPSMPRGQLPYPQATERNSGYEFARSPSMALMRAGLATMAGDSPYAGVNIGKGGLEGLKTFDEQREASRKEETVNQAAERMWNEMQRHTDEFTKIKPSEKIRLALEAAKFNRGEWKSTSMFDNEGNPILYNDKTGQTKIGRPDEVSSQEASGAAPAGAATPPATQEPVKPRAPLDTVIEPTKEELKPYLTDGPKTLTAGERLIAARGASKIKEEARKNSENASQAISRMDEIKRALDLVPEKGFLSTGTGANARLEIVKGINTLLTASGLTPVWSPEDVANAEAALKAGTLSGFITSRLTGGGQHNAAVIIQAAVKATPSLENTKQGAALLISANKQIAERERDRYHFLVKNASKFKNDLNAASIAFDRLNPPDKYVTRARLYAVPEADMAVMRKNLNNPAARTAFDKKYGAGLLDHIQATQ